MYFSKSLIFEVGEWKKFLFAELSVIYRTHYILISVKLGKSYCLSFALIFLSFTNLMLQGAIFVLSIVSW